MTCEQTICLVQHDTCKGNKKCVRIRSVRVPRAGGQTTCPKELILPRVRQTTCQRRSPTCFKTTCRGKNKRGGQGALSLEQLFRAVPIHACSTKQLQKRRTNIETFFLLKATPFLFVNDRPVLSGNLQ